VGHPTPAGFHHLYYSMQNLFIAVVLLLGTLCSGRVSVADSLSNVTALASEPGVWKLL
jgi:hypothetical protein